MIQLYSTTYWLITIVPSAIVLLFAVWHSRTYWSLRLVAIAAAVNLLVLYGVRVIHCRGNGINAPGTPGWIIAPVFTLATFLSTVVMVLMALGYLSFVTGIQRRFSKSSLNLCLLIGVVACFALLGYIGFRAERPIYRPLDPKRSFHPDRPLSKLMTATLRPKRAVFIYGTPTVFEITLTNTGQRDIHLGGLPLQGLQFRPHVCLGLQRADGRDLSFGTDLTVPPDRAVLAPGSSLTFDFPPWLADSISKSRHQRDPRALGPGEYSAFAFFWIQQEGEFQRVLSDVVSFAVRE